MDNLKAQYFTSVTNIKDLPKISLPQICVAGRSNAGKSSFINMITGSKKTARVSATPGRTRMINFFDINGGAFFLVDLPGYGYQKGVKTESDNWSSLIDGYLKYGEDITHTFVLMDIRHQPSELDKRMLNFLYHYQLPFTVLASKSDKLSRAQIHNGVKEIAKVTALGADNIIPFSSLNGHNKELIISKIYGIIDFYKNQEEQPQEQEEE